MIIGIRCKLLLVAAILWHSGATGKSPADSTRTPCYSCESLLQLYLPEVRIDSAAIEKNRDPAASSQRICRVLGTIGKEIAFELMLPEQWNQRFVMGGGGGFVGTIMNRARHMAGDGYATVGTDTGHRGSDAAWGLNDMERQLNFGHAAVHRTAQTARAIIRHFYGLFPKYSYFIGLSRGGGQAMMEAQRYPEDFDGIVAGAPAFNWAGMAAKFILNTRALYPSAGSTTPVVTKENLALLQKMILDRCDGNDGVRDGILNNPLQCDFDLDQLPHCRGDAPGADCFTSAQIEAIRTIYSAAGTGDKLVHAGFPWGGENEKTGWLPAITGPNKGSSPYRSGQEFFGMETFKYLIFNNPHWDPQAYSWDRVYEDTRYAAAYLNATSTDYSAFRERGGKMIWYQGWIDPLISASDLLRHYQLARTGDPGLEDYIRLFMLPGVTHTGGNGPGKADWFSHIRDWVEKGIAPERVIVSRTENGKTTMSRPVFPFPRTAVYKGTGNPDHESSYQ